jgi:hypothetical protein
MRVAESPCAFELDRSLVSATLEGAEMKRCPNLRAMLWLCLVACGDGDTRSEPRAMPGEDASVADASVRCGDDVPPFALGMSALGEQGRVRAVLVEAVPAPPEKYRNDWLVQLEDAAGEALDDAQISEARPFMPAHGHDGTFAPTVTAAGAGRFQVDNLNLWMRGPWEVQLRVSSQAAGDDYIVFRICIEE